MLSTQPTKRFSVLDLGASSVSATSSETSKTSVSKNGHVLCPECKCPFAYFKFCFCNYLTEAKAASISATVQEDFCNDLFLLSVHMASFLNILQ